MCKTKQSFVLQMLVVTISPFKNIHCTLLLFTSSVILSLIISPILIFLSRKHLCPIFMPNQTLI